MEINRSEILTEAPSNKSIRKMNRAENRSAKTAKNAFKQVEKILYRDFDGKYAKNARYYEYKDGTNAVVPVDQATWIKKMNTLARDIDFDNFANNEEAKIAPFYNAIVTDSDNNIIRRGAEDLQGKGVALNSNSNKIKTGYSAADAIKLAKGYNGDFSDDAAQGDVKTDDKQEPTEETSEENKVEAQEDDIELSKTRYKNKIDKLVQIAKLTDLSIVDNNDKPVKPEQIGSYSVSELFIELPKSQELVALPDWIQQATEAKVLPENFNRHHIVKLFNLNESKKVVRRSSLNESMSRNTYDDSVMSEFFTNIF